MKNQRINQSSGVTIIEVLFSIGIIVTGLLGVAGLIMVAGTQMTQGLEADTMSNVGLNAIAEFETREMGRPDNLLWYNPRVSYFTPLLANNFYCRGLDGEWGRADFDDDNNGATDDISEAGLLYDQGPDGQWGREPDLPEFDGDDDLNGTIDDISEAGWPGSDDIYQPAVDDIPSPSFCIDPFFIAQQIDDNNLTSPAVSYFPGISIPAGNPDQIVQMLRVTLKNNNPGAPYPMELLQSREIFLAKDDLSISKPTSATELPQQTWIETQAGKYVKRLNAVETSWMATLTPNRNRINLPTSISPLEPTDQYLFSIVIFNNRFINYIDPNTAPEKERLLNIEFLNEGFGGGEVRLSHTDPAALELKHSDWVMLSADSKSGSCFRWYRISYIEDKTPNGQINSNGEYYREATLKGPDWSRPEWHPTRVPPNQYRKTYVTYIPRVIGVFEKTIRLESTSLY